MRLLLSVVMLTVVYALALSSLDPWDLATGAAISIVLLVLFRPVTIGHHAARLPGLPERIVAFLSLVARVAFSDVVVGAWAVALVMVYFIGVDWERQVRLFHCLEASDPDGIRRTMAHFYQRYQRPVFP